MTYYSRAVSTFVLLAFAATTSFAAWPEFRGPLGDGHASIDGGSKTADLPLRWSEAENVRWKTEIPLRGWSTPVILDGQIWLTTAAEDGHDFYALGLDAATGKIVHNIHLFHSDNPEPLGNNLNCYAAPSAALEAGRVYVHFGSFGTACLDTATGKVLWKRDDLPCRHYRGPSSSPVIFENLLILTFDGADLQYVTALNKETGETVWKTDRNVEWNDENLTGEYAKYAAMAKDGDFRKAHSTPLVVTGTNGDPLMLSGGAKAAFGYEPRTGQELWRVHFDDWSVAPRPLYRDGVAYLVTGLMHPEMWAVRTDGAGDVTDTHVTWRLKTKVAKTASPLLVDGLIYMVADDGVANCVDAGTGEIVWSKRIGGRYAASPIYADDRLYFFNQEGIATVVKPGREYELLATNTLDDGFMASPAVEGNSLILRTKTHLYRIEDAQREGE